MRYAVLVNRQYDLVSQINAVGHLGIGMSSIDASQSKLFRRFDDQERNFTSCLTDCPLIVFSAKNDRQILKAHRKAMELKVAANAFFDCHFSDDPIQQECSVSSRVLDSQIYVALLLYGDDNLMRECTKRLSLLKSA